MIPRLTLNDIIAGSIYALIGLGFVLAYRTAWFFHFAHGVVYAVGAYTAYAAAQLSAGGCWLLGRTRTRT